MDDAFNYLGQRSLSGKHHTSVMAETHRTGVAWKAQHKSHNGNGLDPMSTIESFPERRLESCHRAGPVALHPFDSEGVACDEGGHETMSRSHPQSERLLIFSAADEGGISRIAAAYEQYFRSHPVSEYDNVYLDRLAHTLATHRTSMAWRSFAVLKTTRCLEEVGSFMSKASPPAAKQGAKAFIFTGQGAQYRRMGVELFKHPVFKGSIDEFDAELRVLGCSWSVAALLCEEGPVEHDLDDPEYSQPATTALQIASYELMCALGAKPDVVLGHSSGEIAAAFAAGALSLHSACKASFERGRLASGLKRSTAHPGAMLAVDISEEEMYAFMEKHHLAQGTLCVACINSPCNVTVAGDESDIDLLQEHLQREDIRVRKLATGVAYHSHHMSAIAMEYEERLSGLTCPPKSPTSPSMISSVTGQYVRDVTEVGKPSYWVQNLVSPVQFVKALSIISQSIGKTQTRKLGAAKVVTDIRDLVEIGPHSALRRPVLDNLIHHKVPEAKERYHSVLVRKFPASQSALQLIGELFIRGYPVNVQSANLLGMTSPTNPQLLIDLPSYPFNHSKSYWHESIISQHARVRRAPKQELLGVPVSDWNPLEPRWRSFLDVSEAPWKGEHLVNGKAIYPATGMVVMAIEAAKQVADPTRPISGYRIRDAVFLAPIPVEDDRSEVQLHMRPDHAHPVDKSTGSFEFRVYCSSSTGWFESCHGFVQIVYENDRSDNEDARRRENRFFSDKFSEAQKQCVHYVPTEQMYQNFVTNGFTYGPAFQGLDNLYWDGRDTAIGDVRCFKWTAEQSLNARQIHVAHPTTLDAAGQLAWVVLTEGATKSLANGFAVTRVQYMWLANSGLTYPGTDHIRVWNQSAVKGLRGTDCSVFALNDADELVLQIRHFETTIVGGRETVDQDERPRDICYDMVYKPDLSLMDAKQLACATTLGDTDAKAEILMARFYQDLEAALFYLAKKTRDETLTLDPSQTLTKPHMTRYVTWLDRQIRRYEVGDLTWRRQGWIRDTNDNSEMETLINSLEAANEQGQVFARVGRALVSIIQGVQDPLAVIFESRLAERYYQEICNEMPCSRRVTKYLQLLSHKNPHMSVLEVGAGAGSMTGHIIEGLGHRFSQYVYTDISPAYFKAAAERFAAFESKLAFRLLDVEKDAVEQGYQAESYDVVVAAWVLHATRDLASTIQNVRRLLKPSGKLILVEITEPEILRNGFIFGTLPGWRSGLEPERNWGPCVPGPKWTQLLLNNGFKNVDLMLHDYEDPVCRENSIIIASRDGSESLSDAAPTTPVTLLLGGDSWPQADVAKGLRSTLEQSAGINCQIDDSMDNLITRGSANSTLVFLAELHQPYLSALNEDSFRKLKAILSSAKLVIWLAHSCKTSSAFPDTEMVKGLSRVLCTEKPSLRFVTLKFENSLPGTETCIRLASQVITATLRDSSSEACELEYVEREGTLMISRVYSSDQLNKEVHAKNHTLLTDRTIQQSPPLALKVPAPGLIDSLRWEADLSCAQFQPLGDDEIEIEVQAIGVNFRDLLVVLGKVNASTVGCECAGVVTRVGANCSSRFLPGDLVCAGVLGCARTHVRSHLDLAVKVPPLLSIEEAASLPITGVTAYYSLVTLANLRKEDSILIHSATGGTGQMALQLAQSIGAQTFVTVGTEEKRKLLIESFGVPEENILYSRDTSFAQELLRRTDGRGVDVVLNSLSGGSLLASWECVAPFGRFIELGKADIQANSNLPMSRFFGEISFHAVAVDYIVEHRPALFQKLLQAVINLVQDKKLEVASPLNLYSVPKIESAFRNMQSGRNIGKLVLTLSPSDVVPVSGTQLGVLELHLSCHTHGSSLTNCNRHGCHRRIRAIWTLMSRT
jgi:acyl transferase domain-containing protein/NADPH:quinone reductase-like Zn-dependent oxidoreductase